MFKIIFKTILTFTGLIASYLVIKNSKKIIFIGSNEHFNENTKFLFLHMKKNINFDCYWISTNKKVNIYLNKNNIKSYYYKSLTGLYYILISGKCISHGVTYPNFWNLNKRAIKINLYHGSGPRSTNAGSEINNNNKNLITSKEIVKRINKWDYFIFPSQQISILQGKLCFMLPKYKRLIKGLPRCDHLFNKKIITKSLLDKKILNSIFNHKKKSKYILYTPTWRQNKKYSSLPLLTLNDEQLKSTNSKLSKLDLILIYSEHTQALKEINIAEYSNIKKLNLPIDLAINDILPEVDFMVSDYSSIITDFLIMERPVFLFMPDYNYYINDVGLLYNLKKYPIGKIITSIDDIVESIIKKENAKIYEENIESYMSIFYDLKNNKACESIEKFIEDL
jgi:CDP-glycerol glycerophosphotransferase (TagB/SpsB family)